MPRILSSVKPWPHTDVTTFGTSIPNDWSPVLLWRHSVQFGCSCHILWHMCLWFLITLYKCQNHS